MNKIPVSVLITTKNEEQSIARCLGALSSFSQCIVIDSHSTDKTCEIAQKCGADVVLYQWNGAYPKKRQWCLDTFEIAYDWVFFVDADEVVTEALVDEIRVNFSQRTRADGFFIKGRYIWRGQKLRYGLCNNKLALFNRKMFEFPVINDLDIDGMGEIEGHYQPIRKKGSEHAVIGQLAAMLDHYAYENEAAWHARHMRYAHWEAEMTRRKAWPKDPILWREKAKKVIRTSIFRPYIMFIYSYIIKLGVLDGVNGYHFAKSRKKYCDFILKLIK